MSNRAMRKLAIHLADMRSKFIKHDNIVTTRCKIYKRSKATQSDTDVPGGVFGYDNYVADTGDVAEFKVVKMVIHWTPEARRLAQLGFFVGDDLPILAYADPKDEIDMEDIIEPETYIDGGVKMVLRKLKVVDRKLFGKGTEVRRALLLSPLREGE